MHADLQFLKPQSARVPNAGEHAAVNPFLDDMQVLTHDWLMPEIMLVQPEDRPAQSLTSEPIVALIADQAAASDADEQSTDAVPRRTAAEAEEARKATKKRALFIFEGGRVAKCRGEKNRSRNK